MGKLLSNKPHPNGSTCLAFSPDGRHAFTGGTDSTVRIWNTAEGSEQEPPLAGDAEQSITSVTVSEECWISSSEDSEVRRYVKDRNELHSLVTTGDGSAARCVAVDPQGRRLAVTLDDLKVKVVDLEDTIKVMMLDGHQACVRKASWHPTSEILSTCGADGQIIIWDISEQEPSIIKKINGVIPSVPDKDSPDFRNDCSVIWHTSGEQFYVISQTHDVVCISKEDWKQTGRFTDKEVIGTTTALALSPNGAYLATACQSTVYIWSTDKRQVITRQPANTGAAVTQLAFSPKENLLAWTDDEGNFVRWPDPIPLNLLGPTKRIPATASKPHSALPDVNLFEQDTEAILDGNGDLDALIDDVATAGVEEDDIDIGAYDSGFVIDDDDDMTGVKPSEVRLRDDVREMVSITKAQPAFQPGSTPVQGKKRYMSYNMLGVIEATESDLEEYNLVTVDFFDKSARKSYHFNDTNKCHLAYLGERGALFASDTLVLYKPYGSWTTTQHDWTYSMKKKGTKVLGVAAGGMSPSRSLKHSSDSDLVGFGNVVIATSEGHLRFLSGTGRERRFLALGGDFVSMVAGDEWVLVVYRAGATTIDGSQSLCYKMYNFDDLSVRQRDELPITKGHTLKWLGITEEGAPVIYDSSGMVHLVAKYRVPHHASWVCVLDTNLMERRVGKDESYWPVGISGSTFMCLILKGRQEHPGFPRPLVQELPLRMPFNAEGEKEEQVERDLLFNEMAIEALDDEALTTANILAKEQAIDKEFVMLIQGAIKDDNIPRALELSKLLHHVKTFDVVMKLGDFYHLTGFKEKVQILKEIREESEDRFEAAREKRRRWNKIDDRPLRLPDLDEHGSGSRPKPFQDFGPPPAIYRPGLTRATPAVESTKYSSNNISASSTSDSWPDDPLAPSTDFSSEKRKRADEEDVEMQSQTDSILMPPPKQKPNPFAKKETKGNPFARKPGNNKMVQKSESFFDKVDAAETLPLLKPAKRANGVKGKGKEKEKEKEPGKKEGPRQQTLFGLLGPNQNGDKKSARGKKIISTPPSVEEPESQASDVTMADASQISDVIETQLETQPQTQPEGWEETQLLEDES